MRRRGNRTRRQMGGPSRDRGSRYGAGSSRNFPSVRGRGMPGDANMNNWVNHQDVDIITECVMQDNCSTLDSIYGQGASHNADVNRDGGYNTIDILWARNLAAQNQNVGQYRRGGRVRRQMGGGPKPWSSR